MHFSKLLAIPAIAAIGFFGFTATASAATTPAPSSICKFNPKAPQCHPTPPGAPGSCTPTSFTTCVGDSPFPVTLGSHGKPGDPKGHGKGHKPGDPNGGQPNWNKDPRGGHCHIPQVKGQDNWNKDGQGGNKGCGNDNHGRGNCGCQVQAITFDFAHGSHWLTEDSGPALHTGEVVTYQGQTYTIAAVSGSHFEVKDSSHSLVTNTGQSIRHGHAQTVCEKTVHVNV